MAAISLLTGIPGTTNRVGVLGTKVKQTGLTTFVGGLSTPNGSVAMSVKGMVGEAHFFEENLNVGRLAFAARGYLIVVSNLRLPASGGPDQEAA